MVPSSCTCLRISVYIVDIFVVCLWMRRATLIFKICIGTICLTGLFAWIRPLNANEIGLTAWMIVSYDTILKFNGTWWRDCQMVDVHVLKDEYEWHWWTIPPRLNETESLLFDSGTKFYSGDLSLSGFDTSLIVLLSESSFSVVYIMDIKYLCILKIHFLNLCICSIQIFYKYLINVESEWVSE